VKAHYKKKGIGFNFTLPNYNTTEKQEMKKILIVDDRQYCYVNIHSKNNFEVFIARDGQEALDILNNQLPDVIILN
jgi:PleD family two-component response regulator